VDLRAAGNHDNRSRRVGRPQSDAGADPDTDDQCPHAGVRCRNDHSEEGDPGCCADIDLRGCVIILVARVTRVRPETGVETGGTLSRPHVRFTIYGWNHCPAAQLLSVGNQYRGPVSALWSGDRGMERLLLQTRYAEIPTQLLTGSCRRTRVRRSHAAGNAP